MTTDGGVFVEASVDGETQGFSATDVFVATGVRPNTEDIGLNAVGIETDDWGAVVVDEYYGTRNPDVFAAGDCIGDPMRETVAAKEGNHVVKNSFGDEDATIDYAAVSKDRSSSSTPRRSASPPASER